MERPLKIRLHILSPVHIGCDNEYEPTGFVIDEKKNKLIAFDPLDFITSLSSEDKQRFTQICMKGSVSSILEIYKFIANKPIKGREIEIAAGFLSHYKKVMGLPINDEHKIQQELNKFAISRTAYNPQTNMPYIPGSSLKGSLRTAYLNKLAKDKGIEGRRNAKDLENELLGGSFDSDPFRLVKPSDLLPVNDAGTKILYAVNKKKKISKFEARGPFQMLETIKQGAIFEGIINADQSAGIKTPINTKELLKSINKFYIPMITEENKMIKDIGGDYSIVSKINEQFKDKIGLSAFILRIGRHSGAEAVTIEGNREIKIMQGKGQPPKFLDHATTIWLASETDKPDTDNELVPFGWVMMEIL